MIGVLDVNILRTSVKMFDLFFEGVNFFLYLMVLQPNHAFAQEPLLQLSCTL